MFEDRYCIVRNFGRVKFWQFCLNCVLANQNLANGDCRSDRVTRVREWRNVLILWRRWSEAITCTEVSGRLQLEKN